MFLLVLVFLLPPASFLAQTPSFHSTPSSSSLLSSPPALECLPLRLSVSFGLAPLCPPPPSLLCVPSIQVVLIRSVVPAGWLKHRCCLLQLARPLTNTSQHRGAPHSALFINWVGGGGGGWGGAVVMRREEGKKRVFPLCLLVSFSPLSSSSSSSSSFSAIREAAISVHTRPHFSHFPSSRYPTQN